MRDDNLILYFVFYEQTPAVVGIGIVYFGSIRSFHCSERETLDT